MIRCIGQVIHGLSRNVFNIPYKAIWFTKVFLLHAGKTAPRTINNPVAAGSCYMSNPALASYQLESCCSGKYFQITKQITAYFTSGLLFIRMLMISLSPLGPYSSPSPSPYPYRRRRRRSRPRRRCPPRSCPRHSCPRRPCLRFSCPFRRCCRYRRCCSCDWLCLLPAWITRRDIRLDSKTYQ